MAAQEHETPPLAERIIDIVVNFAQEGGPLRRGLIRNGILYPIKKFADGKATDEGSEKWERMQELAAKGIDVLKPS